LWDLQACSGPSYTTPVDTNGLDGCGAGEHGKRGFRADSAGV
jgi:hypothetical protein